MTASELITFFENELNALISELELYNNEENIWKLCKYIEDNGDKTPSSSKPTKCLMEAATKLPLAHHRSTKVVLYDYCMLVRPFAPVNFAASCQLQVPMGKSLYIPPL